MKIDIETEQLIATIKLDLLQTTFPDNLHKRIAEESVAIRQSADSPLEKLQKLYQLSGEVMSYVEHFTPCKKGCNQCCYYQVSISALEVSQIENATGVKAADINTDLVRSTPVTGIDNANENVAKQNLSDSRHHGTPCPFLSENGECGNYENRPYLCRRHATISLDNHWCHHERVNLLELPLICFEELDKLYEDILKESGNDRLFEIREVFSTD